MTDRQEQAERCLVATAAYLATRFDVPQEIDLYCERLRHVLPDVVDGKASLAPITASVQVLLDAQGARARSGALMRLRMEVSKYFEAAALARLDVLRLRAEGGA